MSWFRHSGQLLVSHLKLNLRLAFQIMKPGRVSVKARIGSGNHVVAIVLKVTERGNSLFTCFTTGRGQQENWESLYLAAELSAGEPVEQDIDCHKGSENREEFVSIHKIPIGLDIGSLSHLDLWTHFCCNLKFTKVGDR